MFYRFCCTLAAITLLTGLSAAEADAQLYIPFPALDPSAISLAATTAADSTSATDLFLTLVTGQQYSLLDGTAVAWIYWFYSPSLRRRATVLVVNRSGSMTVVGWGSGTIAASAEQPVALDTTGGFVSSASLAAKLLGSAEFQRFRYDHPADGGPYVSLMMLPANYPYQPPAGFPTTEALWVVNSDRFGDSTFVCFYATASDTLWCGAGFYLGNDYQLATSAASDVDFGVSNYGAFGGDFAQQASAFTVPSGSGRSYIYGAGIWIGALRGGNASVLQSYNPNSGGTDMQPGDGYDPRTSYSHPNIYLSSYYDAGTGEPIDVRGEFKWPLWLRPGSADATLMNPGEFVRKNENRVVADIYSRPAMLTNVSEHFVSRYSDTTAGGSGDTTTRPLGLQVMENVFANPGGFHYTVIVTYEIVNVSGETLSDVVVGPVVDFDIGTATNDRIRFYQERPDLRTALAWSAPESGGLPFGTLAMTVVEAPMVDGGGFVDNSVRSSYCDDGRLSGFRSWTIEIDPKSSVERYDFMRAGQFDGDLSAGDRRGVLVSSPFDMAPGDTAHFAVAYTVLRNLPSAPTGTLSDVDVRVENVIRAFYDSVFVGVEAPQSASAQLQLSLAPNPTRDRIATRFVATRGPASISVYSQTGALVMRRELGSVEGPQLQTLDLSGLPNGSYTIVVANGASRASSRISLVR